MKPEASGLVNRKFLDAFGNTLKSWQLGLGGARLRSNAGTVETRSADNSTAAPFLALQVKAPSVSTVGIRQTVLSGLINNSGQPAVLTAGTGLNLVLSAASTSLTLAFASGFDSYGAVDYVGQLTSNLTLALPANATCFLYVDRNPTTGVLTFGFYQTVGYSYGSVFPTSPATNLHFFNTSTFQMQYWNGSAWVICQRVILGEVSTNANALIPGTITTYAYQGKYASAWTAVSGGLGYVFAHNLGCPLASSGGSCVVYSSQTGNDNAAVLATVSLSNNGFYYYPPAAVWKNVGVVTQASPLLNDSNSAWLTSGFYKVIVQRGF